MTKINFYRIDGSLDDALTLSCQLAEKAFQQGMTVLLQTQDHAVASKLDSLLWSFKPTAFLPHSVEQSPTDRISISSNNGEPGNHHGLLINLSDRIPNWFSRFEKAVEIVYQDQHIMAKKRDHFRFYKNRGYPLQYHDITGQ